MLVEEQGLLSVCMYMLIFLFFLSSIPIFVKILLIFPCVIV